MKVDKRKRFVASELLLLIIDFKASHELWRIRNVFKDGLTPKEQAYLQRCMDDLADVWARLQKLRAHLDG